jgi:hypothetical protein
MKNWLCVLGTYLVIVVVVRHDDGFCGGFGLSDLVVCVFGLKKRVEGDA